MSLWWARARSACRSPRTSRDRRVRAFGEPMQTWRTRMPPDMRLRSDWEETSLSAPGDGGSIDSLVGRRRRAARGADPAADVPALRGLVPRDVRPRERSRPTSRASSARTAGSAITTTAGDEADAQRVVIAVGVDPVPIRAAAVRRAMGDGVTSCDRPPGLRAYAGRARRRGRRRARAVSRAAALAAQGGGRRRGDRAVGDVRWFTDREPYRPRGRCNGASTASPTRSSATARRR